jgi:hypothetical protein
MPSRLLVVNVVLAGISLLCVGLIVKQLVSAPATVAARSRAPAAGSAAPPATEPQHLPAPAYAMIASRNLFSPTRSETPGTGLAGGPTFNIVKPNLHGVVLREGAPIAYLEDPLTKRIAGYRIGDPIAGGTVQTISADAVVIARPDGVVDVRLRDPSKPKPPAPGPAGQQPVPGQVPVPAQPPVPGQFQIPGTLRPPTPIPQPTPGVAPVPRVLPPGPQVIQPGQTAPGFPAPEPVPRPSPSLGRRFPATPVDPNNPQPVPQN